MDVAGEHDMRGAQARLRRDDALADSRRIDRDHRRVLEDPRAGLSRQHGEAMDIAAAVDLERFWIIHAVEIALGLQFGAHAIDLPALDLGIEILGQHLQPADQPVADVDVGDFQRAFAEGAERNQRCRGADVFGALPRQRPQFAGVLETDPFDQVAERHAKTRHHRAELMAGRIPADMAALEHGDAGPEPCRFARHGEAGKAGADHADIDIEIEGQPRALQQRLGGRCGVMSIGRACGRLAHCFYLRTVPALVTLSCHQSLYINRT